VRQGSSVRAKPREDKERDGRERGVKLGLTEYM